MLKALKRNVSKEADQLLDWYAGSYSVPHIRASNFFLAMLC